MLPDSFSIVVIGKEMKIPMGQVATKLLSHHSWVAKHVFHTFSASLGYSLR